MALTAQQIVGVIYPTPVDPPLLAAVLELAEARTSSDAYDGVREQAVAYLAMHLLALRATDVGAGGSGVGPAGPLTSETEGRLSRSYAAAGGGGDISFGDADLGRTTYGQQLLALRREQIFRPRIRTTSATVA